MTNKLVNSINIWSWCIYGFLHYDFGWKFFCRPLWLTLACHAVLLVSAIACQMTNPECSGWKLQEAFSCWAGFVKKWLLPVSHGFSWGNHLNVRDQPCTYIYPWLWTVGPGMPEVGWVSLCLLPTGAAFSLSLSFHMSASLNSPGIASSSASPSSKVWQPPFYLSLWAKGCLRRGPDLKVRGADPPSRWKEELARTGRGGVSSRVCTQPATPLLSCSCTLHQGQRRFVEQQPFLSFRHDSFLGCVGTGAFEDSWERLWDKGRCIPRRDKGYDTEIWSEAMLSLLS